MKKWLITLAMLMIASPLSYATTFAAYHGWCEKGNQKVVTTGLNSTNTVQGSFGACTVTVNLHGGGVATIYSDAGITPIANPFTASADGTITFFADVSATYDIIETGGTGGGFSAPYTLFSVTIGGGGGGGGGTTLPGGSPDDVQVNVGNTTFGGTGGLLQYHAGLAQLSLSGALQFLYTASLFDLSGGTHTRPIQAGTQASGLVTACTSPAELYLATDALPQPVIMPCVGGFFAAPLLPSVPGTTGQLLANVGSGALGVYTGLAWDPIAAVLNVPGTMSLNSTKPFSMSGSCPSSTPLGASSVGTALLGWDVGCIPKISFNGGPTLAVGLQTLIDYTYIKLDANNCWAIGPTTGDIGIARIAAGVLGIMNCGSTSSPTKINIYNTFSSSTNGEYMSAGWTNSGPSAGWFVGADHASLGGSYHPLLFGAAGSSNPFWEITTTGPFICVSTNPSCDLGSITTSQQMRNIWQAGFLAENIIGPTYPVDAAGVQIGLVAAPTSSNPVKAATATTTSTSGTLGIVGFLSNGSITGATIVSGGTGYTAPTCQVTTPTNPASVPATCTTHQTAGVIDTVTITNTGANNGYQSIQGTTITINDPNGTGASILPIITSTTGFAGIAYTGSTLSPIFDGPVTIRHRIVISPTVNGELHDTGFPCPAFIPLSQQSYGCSLATNAGGAGISVLTQVNILPAINQVMLATVPSATNCPTAASIGAACKDTITLTPAQPDTNYVVNCSIPLVTGGVPTVGPILAADKGLGSFKITVLAATAVAAQVTNWDCTVSHP